MRLAVPLFLVVVSSCPARDAPPPPPSPGATASVAATAPSAGSANLDAALSAPAIASGPPALPPLPRIIAKVQTGVCGHDGADASGAKSGEAWVNTRVAKARRDHHEIVRAPYDTSGFTRSIMPMDHVCDLPVEFDRRGDVDVFQGKAPEKFAYPELAPPSVQGEADGWYRHERVKEKYEDGNHVDVYDLPVFVVWHVKPAPPPREKPVPEPPPSIVAELDDDEIDVPQLHDDRPWLLVLATLPYDAPHVDDEAGKQRDRAVVAGFPAAEVIDTRQTTQLFCCSRVVVAGRYATLKEANADLTQARHTWAAAYVRKGW
jgi:hypothetical protein